MVIVAVAAGIGIGAATATIQLHEPATLEECAKGMIRSAGGEYAVRAAMMLCRRQFPSRPVAETLPLEELKAEVERRGFLVVAPKSADEFLDEPEKPAGK